MMASPESISRLAMPNHGLERCRHSGLADTAGKNACGIGAPE
jgi:hypothetical protein